MNCNIFSYGFWPEKFLINSLSLHLSKNNKITVSTGMPNYPYGNFFDGYGYLDPLKEKFKGVAVLRHPVVPRKKGLICLSLNYFTNLFFGCLNIFRLPKSDCNFVFATSPIFTAIPAILHSKLFGAKTVIWLQDLWPESFLAITGFAKNSLIDKLLGLMVKWIYKNTDLILIQSEGFKENLIKYGYKGKVEWVPNWAISEEFKESPSWIGGIPEDKFVVTFAGNIGTAQGLETLLEAAKILENNENIYFVIVGDGREKSHLEAKYLNSENIKFFGNKPTQDMLALFKKSSGLVVMLKEDESLESVIPSKFQSYMIAAKPIITSLNGAGAKLAREYSLGPVVKAESPKELASEILNLSKLSVDEQKSFGINAYNLYKEKFEISEVQNRIEQLLNDIIK